MSDLQRTWQELLQAAARRRWLLAGSLAAAAVATGLPSLVPAPAATATVLAAAHDLPAGATLTAQDVTRLAVPAGLVPDGSITSTGAAAGRVLAGAVRRGEPLTDVRLVGPGLLAGLGADAAAGLVAVPVRLADPAAAALLRAGDRVDVLAASTSPDAPAVAAVIAAAAPVLAVPAPDGGLEGAVVVVATPAATAARLAAAAVSSRLSVVVRG